MAKSVITEISRKTVDDDTGEIINEQNSTKVVSISREPKHIKLYYKDIELIYELPQALSKTLYELAKYATFENRITLGGYVREKLSGKLEIKPKTLRNRLDLLVKKQMLFKMKGFHSEYLLNPKIFGNGDWNKIRRHRSKIKTLIEYSAGRRKINHTFSED